MQSTKSSENPLRCAIFTAKLVERDAVARHLIMLERATTDAGRAYRLGHIASSEDLGIANKQLLISLAHTGELDDKIGQVPAAAVIVDVLAHFKPHMALFVGCAGGRPNTNVRRGDQDNQPLQLFDVVVSKLVHYYERESVQKKAVLIKE